MSDLEKSDFYRFVNQEWLDANEIPKGFNRWGTFNEIDKDNKAKLLLLLDEIKEEDSNGMKVKVLFNQFLNRHHRLKSVISDVESFITEINSFKSKRDLNRFITERFIAYDISTPLMLSVDGDLDDSSMNILHISSSGLGLPDKDYYFDKKHKDILEEYKKFMKEYLSLFGEFNYQNIFLIEEKLAECAYSKIEKRNIQLMNNKYDLDVIDINFQKFYIKDTLDMLNLKPNDKINIINPKMLRRYHEMWECITIKNWIEYYTWVYLRSIGTILSKETDKIIFNFYSGVMNGVYEMKPKEERAVEFVDGKLGMVLSQVYVKKYFNNDKRKMISDLVESIKIIFKQRLEMNQWMGEETRQNALVKLSKMNFKIVCPNDGEWRDYNDLVISDDVFLLENVLRIKKFETDFEFSELNQPVDRTRWFMNPHDVNAYYSPTNNEIVFPAGILQGDFFGDDMISNFGAIGVVIGHEITHGFDDEGCKFDCDGNLRKWFTEDDIKRFDSRTIKLQTQFSKLSIEGLNIDGKLTLGENIADLGGVVISYNAMDEYMRDKGGVTDEDRKRFFTSYAKIWKCKSTPESTKLRVTTDPHSPPEFRVNQILGNFKPFLDLYGISESDPMYIVESDRADIW